MSRAAKSPLERLQERIQTEINASKVVQVFEVFVEGRARGRWTGRTRGNTKVHFADERELAGKLVDVRMTESSPWFLIGVPVSGPR